MAGVKRLNYFNSQFLVDKDFTDEQSYHLEMRRRHNLWFHTWGVAGSGLVVSTVQGSNKSISVSAGMALDNLGQEIVITEPQTLDLSASAPNSTVFVSLQYKEDKLPEDHYVNGGIDNYVRITEEAILQSSPTAPPADGSVILLAKVHLDANGVVDKIDNSARPLGGSLIPSSADLQIDTLSISGSITLNDNSLLLHTDKNSGLGWYGTGKLFAGANVDGPVAFGNTGGGLGTTNGGQKIALSWNSSGNVGIGTTTAPSARLEVGGDLRIDDGTLYLRTGPGGGSGDTNHGFAWYGVGKLFGSVNVDGPVAFGFSGGALGTTNGGQKIVLSWLANGNVGIGPTNTPQNKLTVDLGSSAPVDTGITIQGSTTAAGDLGLRIKNTGPGGVEWYIDSTNNSSGYGGGNLAIVPGVGGQPALKIQRNGSMIIGQNVGINTNNPTQALHVHGMFITVDGSGNEQCYIGGDGAGNDVQLGSLNPGVSNVSLWNTATGLMDVSIRNLNYTGGLNHVSDARLKTNIEPLSDVLSKITKVKAISYDWNDEYKSLGSDISGRQIGIVAQELQKVFPELVTTWGEKEYLGIDYAKLTVILLEALKELNAKVDALSKQVATTKRQAKGNA